MLDYIFSWNTLFWLLLVLYLPACFGLVGVVLLQKGKGTGFQGAFGAGTGAETVFGPRTSRSLPQRITYTMAGLFMVLALTLSLLSGRVGRGAAPALADETAAPEAAQSQEMDELFEGESAAGASTPVTVTPQVEGNVVTIPSAESAGATPGEAAVVDAAPADQPAAAPAPEAVPVDTPASIPVDAGTPTESVVPPPVGLTPETPAVPSENPPAEAPAEDANQ